MAIEFGHCRLAPDGEYEAKDELILSAHYARNLKDFLECWQVSSRMQILLDDKQLDENAGRDAFVEVIQSDVAKIIDADEIYLESRLREAVDAFCEGIVPEKRESVEYKLRNRLLRHGALACSQDIAIWHTYRLGLLTAEQDFAVINTPDDHQSVTPDLVISLLDARFEIFEKKADRDYLRWHSKVRTKELILRYYTGAHSEDPMLTENEWISFRSRVVSVLQGSLHPEQP